MSGSTEVVVVGGGQAGYQLASSLSAHGFGGTVRLICDEPSLALSAPSTLQGVPERRGLHRRAVLRDGGLLPRQAVDVLEDRAVAIDPESRTVRLASKRVLEYERLVLATGARKSSMPGAEDVAGVLSLRTSQMRWSCEIGCSPKATSCIIGGGFLGLEVASVCADWACRCASSKQCRS